MKSGSFLDYYRYETDGVDDNASESKSFRYKTNIIEKMQGQPQQSGNAKKHRLDSTTTSGILKRGSHYSNQIYQ